MNPSTPTHEAPTTTIMQRLKHDTQRLHDETEHGTFNKALVTGHIPLDGYVAMLAQFLLVHRALEGHLQRKRSLIPALSAVLTDRQFQETCLLEDLAHFGCDATSIEPFQATRRFVAAIDELAVLNPVALLGIHYVLEGSKNGSRFIARALRRAYGLAGSAGLRYFDPYGDEQPALWQDFKQAMNGVDFTDVESAALSAAACDAFARIIDLHTELGARYSAVEAQQPFRCPFAGRA